MHIRYATVDVATGQIYTIGLASTVEDALNSDFLGHPPVLYPPEEVDTLNYWYNNDAFELRPVTPEPSASYDLTTLPEGTTVTVTNEAGDEMVISELVGTLTLTDPGDYKFIVEPPFPYMEIRTIIEVT